MRHVTMCRSTREVPWGFSFQGGSELGLPLVINQVDCSLGHLLNYCEEIWKTGVNICFLIAKYSVVFEKAVIAVTSLGVY